MFNKNYRLLNYSLIVAMLLGQSPLPAYATVSSFDDKVGIGDPSPDGILELDVEGPIGATQYCDQNGANCTAAADLGGGKWLDGVGTNEIYYSAADVGIGTNAPARSLHISKNTPSKTLRFLNLDSDYYNERRVQAELKILRQFHSDQ